MEYIGVVAKVFRHSLLLLIVSLAFDARHIFFTLIDGIEYARLSLYVSDVPLALFIISGIALVFRLWTTEDLFAIQRFKGPLIALAIFFMAGIVSLTHASSLWLGLYTLLRLGALVLMALLLAYGMRRNVIVLRDICLIIVSLAVAQSLIGFLQFRAQSDLGLQYLGESVLSAGASGVAKIIYAGTAFIRAYGTFPHPNVFGAFLVIGFLACAYLWIESRRQRFLLTPATFIILLGLLLSFSRAAWSVLVAMIVFFFYKTIKCLLCSDPAFSPELRTGKRQIADIVILFVSVVLCSVIAQPIIFWPFVTHRFSINANDAAISERVTYAQIAFDEIRERPLLGVGVGNHVLYGIEHQLYQSYGMTHVWQWQPAHNIYLLIFSEVGIFGFLFFVSFIFIAIAMKMKDQTIHSFLFILMLVSLLILGFFDHFLWTLEQGRLLFWVVLGILMGISGARSSTDRMHPSEW